MLLTSLPEITTPYPLVALALPMSTDLSQLGLHCRQLSLCCATSCRFACLWMVHLIGYQKASKQYQ